MDGAPLPGALDGRALQLHPGEHTFRFEPAGQPPLEKKLVLRQGKKERRESVVLGPVPTTAPPVGPPPSSWSTRKTLAIVSAGLGVVGVGLGAAFGAYAVSAQSREKSDCSAATCLRYAQSVEDYNTAQKNATGSTLASRAGRRAGRDGRGALVHRAQNGRGASRRGPPGGAPRALAGRSDPPSRIVVGVIYEPAPTVEMAGGGPPRAVGRRVQRHPRPRSAARAGGRGTPGDDAAPPDAGVPVCASLDAANDAGATYFPLTPVTFDDSGTGTWDWFDTSALVAHPTSFSGGTFDGRHVYFAGRAGYVVQYDPQGGGFEQPASWSSFVRRRWWASPGASPARSSTADTSIRRSPVDRAAESHRALRHHRGQLHERRRVVLVRPAGASADGGAATSGFFGGILRRAVPLPRPALGRHARRPDRS